MNQAEKNRICELIKQNKKTEIVINYTLKSGAAKRASKIDSADAHKKTSALSILQTGDFLVSKFLILYYKVPEMDVLHEYIPLLLLLF